MKPTKTALKKAAKAARLEKRQQKATASGRNTPNPPSPISAEDGDDELASTPENNEELPLPAVSLPTVEDYSTNRVTESTVEPKLEPEPVIESKPPVVEPKPSVVESQPAPTPAPEPESPPLVITTLPEKQTPAKPAPPPTESEQTIKRQNMLTRTLWTFIMIGGFISTCFTYLLSIALTLCVIALLLLGHAYMILLVMLCQTAVYREVTALFSIKYIEGEDTSLAKDPWSKTLNWYFFAVANYYLYGESIIYYFKVWFMNTASCGMADYPYSMSCLLMHN